MENNSLNLSLFHAVNDIRGDVYDMVMIAISSITSRSDFGYYLIIFAILAVLEIQYTKQCRSSELLETKIKWGKVLAVFIIAHFVNLGVIELLKNFFHQPRPFVALPAESLRYMGPPMGTDQFNLSFPSGHASFATLVAASIWPATRGVGKLLAIAFVVLVCWSRLALGVHYPIDVVAGSAIALTIVLAIRHLVVNKFVPSFPIRS